MFSLFLFLSVFNLYRFWRIHRLRIHRRCHRWHHWWCRASGVRYLATSLDQGGGRCDPQSTSFQAVLGDGSSTALVLVAPGARKRRAQPKSLVLRVPFEWVKLGDGVLDCSGAHEIRFDSVAQRKMRKTAAPGRNDGTLPLTAAEATAEAGAEGEGARWSWSGSGSFGSRTGARGYFDCRWRGWV